MSGFIHRQVSHDPDRKIMLPKGTKFKDVLIKSCLHKRYPRQGPYAGGIVFGRYYGVGDGIGFTKTECEEMWGEICLDDHILLVHGDEGEDFTPAGTATPPTSFGGTPPSTHVTPAGTATPPTSFGATPPSTHVTTTPPISDTDTPPTNGTSGTSDTVRPGDCLEVWWTDMEAWYPCAVVDEADDHDGSSVSCCLYDGEKKGRWHNLQVYVSNTRSHLSNHTSTPHISLIRTKVTVV